MIRKYDPFKDFIILKDTFKALEDGLTKTEENSNVWAPRVDISETEANIIVRSELAGLSKEDIKIDVTGDTLNISGERKWVEKENEKYHKIERFYGAFNRTFSIGVPINADDIKASFKDGVLEIIIPKAEKLKQKKIEITSE